MIHWAALAAPTHLNHDFEISVTEDHDDAMGSAFVVRRTNLLDDAFRCGIPSNDISAVAKWITEIGRQLVQVIRIQCLFVLALESHQQIAVLRTDVVEEGDVRIVRVDDVPNLDSRGRSNLLHRSTLARRVY